MPAGAMPEPRDPHLSRVREDLPCLAGVTYLNSGTTGPMPRPVAQAICETVMGHLGEPRTGRAHFDRALQVRQECRAALAGVLGCGPSEIALTHNTTEGMNLITLGVNWVHGDEAITTNVEHPGALLPLWIVRDRYGVTVKTADLLSRPPDPVDAVARLITPRTKLISLSHISYSTGDVLPVAEIAREAHARGVLVLVDGAQSFGSMSLDMASLGADFYSVSGQKWLCGPEGTGALYSAQQAISQIRTTFAGYGTIDGYNDYGGFLVKEDGRRFELGTMNLPDVTGQLAAAAWLTGTVGEGWAHERIHGLAAAARAELGKLDGVEVITGAAHAGLVSFSIGDADPAELVQRLASRSILVRAIPRPAAVRLSAGCFVTDEEMSAAVAAIGEELAALRART
ncbi:MAG TPA: aminotransferase class V-fold PLP-dependent enzyme [Streptosporangiaceae bacterium]|nr:aminotransferase class V-fold PLP-dependent enzyme [Streptosporangiaceae bacterium]